jgi:hypothetical protein
MIPHFAMSTFPAFSNDSALRLPSGADRPATRPAAFPNTVASPGYAFGPDVVMPLFTVLRDAGYLKPLRLRPARGRRP